MESHLAEILIFFSGFFLITALLQEVTKRLRFPYTVALLFLGIFTSRVLDLLHIETHFELSSEVTYLVLLPVLLFGAAMHINFHQFKLQFKTISFLATFGLLTSVFIVTTLLSVLLGLPFEVSLLFGALISSTDPIAVLALFNTLGAPRRLALLADGESMFNDATGVIAFKVISAIALTGSSFSHQTILSAGANFLYMFFGSIFVGAVIGLIISQVIAYIKDDALVETTLTLGAALFAFAGAEHFFHLSGVITAVIAGLVVGNLGRSRFSITTVKFIREFWDYLGFLAVSLVFFFTTFSLDLSLFADQPGRWLAVILIVLLARAVSTYLSFWLTNRISFFRDEPNVPLSWQHILNWGGLRGVIPLVLVFTIPETYVYRDELFVFTLATLLFTLFINGLTIEWLLKWLKIHLPASSESILQEEHHLFTLEQTQQKLKQLAKHQFNEVQLAEYKQKIRQDIQQHKAALLKLSNPAEFALSLKLEMLRLQRHETEQLYREGYISENVFFDFDAQLDLQEDALEYPEVFTGSGYLAGGKLNTRRSFRVNLLALRKFIARFGVIGELFGIDEATYITERYTLIRARMISGEKILHYLRKLLKLVSKREIRQIIRQIMQEQELHVQQNQAELLQLEQTYPDIIVENQQLLLRRIMTQTQEKLSLSEENHY